MIKEILNIYVIITFVITYFICSINPSIIICKKKTGQDIRKLGSGNAGTANAMRVLGKPLGFIVVVLDISKVLISYAIISKMCNIFSQGFEGYIMSSFILSAIFGHCFPVYYGFRGGKGVVVATVLALILNYRYAIVCVIACGLVYVFTKIPSISTLIGILMYLVLIIVMDFSYTVPVAIITFIILFKHRNNIKRIFEKQEKIFKM